MNATEARKHIVAAARDEIRRRELLLSRMADLEPEIVAAALRAFGSGHGAAEWLLQPTSGLSGRVPIDVASTQNGSREVLHYLARLEFDVLS